MKVKVLTMLIAATLGTAAQANPVNDAGKTVGWAIGSVFGSILGVVQDTFQGIEDGIEGKDLTVKGDYAEKPENAETDVLIEPLEDSPTNSVQATETSNDPTHTQDATTITEPLVEHIDQDSNVSSSLSDADLGVAPSKLAEEIIPEPSVADPDANAIAPTDSESESAAFNESSGTDSEELNASENVDEEGFFSRLIGIFKKDTKDLESTSATENAQQVEVTAQESEIAPQPSEMGSSSATSETAEQSEAQAEDEEVISSVPVAEEFNNSPISEVEPVMAGSTQSTAALPDDEVEYEYVVVRHDQLKDGDIVVESAPSPDAIKIKRGN